MLAVRNAFAGGSDLPKSTRKPLQPRNSNVLKSTVAKLKSAIKRDDALKSETSVKDLSEEMGERDWNKENIPVMIEGLDLSLGAELIEMRKRVERLKLDKEETEKRLKEKDNVFDSWMENINRQGEEQRKLEVEIDLIFRTNEMRALTRISPVRSLREKAAPPSILKWGEDDMEESVGENSNGSPDRQRAGHSGDFVADLELNPVSVEPGC